MPRYHTTADRRFESLESYIAWIKVLALPTHTPRYFCIFGNLFLLCCRPVAASTALNAEWEKEWKESNFEADLKKIQDEAEKRLEEKVQELAGNIENTGK